jgi:hypothetical protein
VNAIRQALSRKVKIGKLRVPAWALLAVFAGGAYWWYKRKSAAATTNIGAPAAAAPAGDLSVGAPLSGGGGGASTSDQGQTPQDQTLPVAFDAAGFQSALQGTLQSILDAFASVAPAPTPTTVRAATTSSVSPSPTGAAVPSAQQAASLSSPALARAEFTDRYAAVAYSNPTRPVPASATDFALAASAKTQGAARQQVPIAFGGVVGVSRTKTGATLTTYQTGRVVEQAPGKTAYVAKAGTSAPAAPAPAAVQNAPREPVAAAPSRTQTASAPAAPAPAPTPPTSNVHKPGVQM